MNEKRTTAREQKSRYRGFGQSGSISNDRHSKNGFAIIHFPDSFIRITINVASDDKKQMSQVWI